MESEATPLFKDFFNAEKIELIATELGSVYSPLDQPQFVSEILEDLPSLELKGRVARVAEAFQQHLPSDYPQALNLLLQTLGEEMPDDQELTGSGFMYWPVAHFIETYGLDHLESSIEAMYEVTKRFTAEFAIRPYIVRYPDEMMEVLHRWSKDPNLHVRRLVSEGSRTRLPWGLRLHQFIEDPQPVLPLLETLKDDPELYVRRSVANNLNDLSKDHPELVLDVLEGWQEGASDGTLWITKHALRGLIKAGHPRALALLGFGAAEVVVEEFKVQPERIVLGERFHLELVLRNPLEKDQNLMIDYLVHFIKANGKPSPKVFKWAQKRIKAGETLHLKKSQHIKPITTRRYYAGLNKVEIQINGQIIAEDSFELQV